MSNNRITEKAHMGQRKVRLGSTVLTDCHCLKVVQEDGKFKIEGMELEAQEDMKTLLENAIITRSLVPTNSIRVKPRPEGTFSI